MNLQNALLKRQQDALHPLHLSRFERHPRPYCDDCLVPLTVRHLQVECPCLMDLRHRYLYRCRSRDSGVYYLSKVLGPACLAHGHDVFRFLGEAGILLNL
ncbi:hypothetical protein E2C01_092817 [Portunus trituberculatus]|uniref:Uncharacterized protein n=1 Tax=Portunus trituberculatus TaxID=210409 RepID=A0A5B7JRN1_PORTR|nr:hypothetical protein [Portunus trituberculatus]